MTLADDVVPILSKNGFGHLTIMNATALETKYHMNDVRFPRTNMSHIGLKVIYNG